MGDIVRFIGCFRRKGDLTANGSGIGIDNTVRFKTEPVELIQNKLGAGGNGGTDDVVALVGITGMSFDGKTDKAAGSVPKKDNARHCLIKVRSC